MKLITYSVDLFEIVSQNNWRCDLQDELKGRALSDAVHYPSRGRGLRLEYWHILSLYSLNSTVRLNTNISLEDHNDLSDHTR